MVDWDRVAELRNKGGGWERIADDPKVGFHPDASVREPGRALRALYHRQRSARQRQAPEPMPKKRRDQAAERRWTPIRLLWLLVPLVAIWAAMAYVVPSPIGLIVPAIPWLALALAVLAFLLIYLLLRAEKRWTKVFRTTLIGGVVAGLLFAGMVGLVGFLVFGCPLLPPSSALTSQSAGWSSGGMTPWQDSGRPVLYYYGATWCPFCSASSWAIYKALIEFGNLSGFSFDYSSATDVYPSTPEIAFLPDTQYSSSHISFQFSEDTSGVNPNVPGTSGCFQGAYVSAYGGSAIPFYVINGQYVHGGSTLVNPQPLQSYAGSGASQVQSQVQAGSGPAWNAISSQAYWVMAFLAKSTGTSVGTLASELHWSSATESAVAYDVGQIH